MTADEKTSFAVMDAAIEPGINFSRTADVYGGPSLGHEAEGRRRPIGQESGEVAVAESGAVSGDVRLVAAGLV